MQSQRLKYLLIVLASLLGLLLASYIYFVQFRKVDIEALITKFAESKMNGDLRLVKFRWAFENSKIKLSAEHLSIVDEQANVFFEADNPVAVFPLHGLLSLNPFRHYRLLGASYAKLYLNRDEQGLWNYQKIFKAKEKRKPLIEEANFPNLDIEITDARIPDNKISYTGMKINWSKQGLKRVYNVDVDSGKTSLNNHVYLKGSIATGSLKHILRQRFDLRFDIEDIRPSDFAPILYLVGYDQNAVELVSHLGTLSFKGSLGYFGAKLLHLDGNLTINQGALNFASKILGDFKTIRGETFVNWHLDTMKFNLPAWLEAYAIAFAQHPIAGAEQYPRAAHIIASKFRIIHPQEYVIAKLIAKGTVDKPEFKSEIDLVDNRGNLIYYPATNDIKKVISEFSTKEDKFTISKLIVPLNYASFFASGWITKALAFDLKLQSKGITLTQLKALLLDLPYATIYQDMFRRMDLSGLAALDLRMYRPAPDKEIKITGAAQLAKVGIFHPDYPIPVTNVNALILLKESQWNLSKLTANLGSDYFEATGIFDLNTDPTKPKVSLKIALAELDLAKLVESRLLTLFALERYIKSASGKVSNLLLDIQDVPSSAAKRYYRLLGNFDLNNISINEFNKVSGRLTFMQDGLRIAKLVFSVSDGSCYVNGKLKQETRDSKPVWIPDLDIVTKNLELSKVKSTLDALVEYKKAGDGAANNGRLRFADFEVFDGVLDANLHLDSESAVGALAFNKLNFQYDPLGTPIREAKGSLTIGKDRALTVNTISGLFGASNFKANGTIKNLFAKKSRPIEQQMTVNGNFFMPEIAPLLPGVIKKYCVFKGRMPATVQLSGSKSKMTVSIEADLGALDKFSYFNWLEIAQGYKALLKTRFIITPQLIVSEETQGYFSKRDSTDSPALIKAYFNIKDYKDVNALTYYTKFETLASEANSNAIGVHILTLKPFDINYGTGNFVCQTHGSAVTQQTNCEFKFERPAIYKFGIGDLHAQNVDVKLLSVTNLPMETKIRAAVGDWNTVPFTKLSLEMDSNATSMTCRNVKANIGEGSVVSGFTLNYADLVSSFDIKGQNLPAHDVAQGLWALGAEVPDGSVDISFKGKTKGVEQVEMFMNLVGTADVMVKNGKLSQLKAMQRLLSAVNGFMSFDLNNVAQSLINYQGGTFDYIITALDYNLGLMSSKRLLIKAPQIEMLLKGKADYNTDFLDIRGIGLIPKHEKSLLDKVGVGPVSLGNALSLFKSGDRSKRYFSFVMQGPISNPELTSKSIQESFTWLKELPEGDL